MDMWESDYDDFDSYDYPEKSLAEALEIAEHEKQIEEIKKSLENPVKLEEWTPGTVYGAGDIIKDNNGNIQQCVSRGMSNYGQSGKDDPVWCRKVDQTTLDGTVIWRCVGTIDVDPVLEVRPDPEAIFIEEREV